MAVFLLRKFGLIKNDITFVVLKTNYMKNKIVAILRDFESSETLNELYFADVANEIIEVFNQKDEEQYKYVQSSALTSIQDIHKIYESLLDVKSHKNVVLYMNDDDKSKTSDFINSLRNNEITNCDAVEKFVYGGVNFILKN